MQKAFVGRQPIYREGVDVFAYELFSRSNELNQAAQAKDDASSAEAFLQQFVDVGLEKVVGPHPAFVSVTRDFVLSDYTASVPKNGVVLQVDGADNDDAMLGALDDLLLTRFHLKSWSYHQLLVVSDAQTTNGVPVSIETLG
jgi:EAL and modified HD-GYP domain-containing signal transduction protein